MGQMATLPEMPSFRLDGVWSEISEYPHAGRKFVRLHLSLDPRSETGTPDVRRQQARFLKIASLQRAE